MSTENNPEQIEALEGFSEKILSLENEVKNLKARNRAVEANKAWEVSTCRVLVIALIRAS